ncbi:hypothetical protein ACFQPA_14125 [Halomarina halobia]|uniref:Enolase n=1 Tax=Halomarina halobia TaxID=3033386 RepID=A0ABD6A901_9EURY|nr:hypothetical protein [Halomarina sp. PSR21]
MALFDRLADLPLVIEGHDRSTQTRATSSGFDRTTTTFALRGGGETGKGEDVTYDAEDHERLARSGIDADLAGEYTFAEFSDSLDDEALFPEPPERETGYHYRRWAVESAALDLALRQADADLASALDLTYDSVRFVVSTRLGEPPSVARVEALLERYPDTEFKLDPTSEWGDGLVDALAATGRVRILDLKGQYHGTEVDQTPDPALYRRVIRGFPEAVVEDPAIVEGTESIVTDAAERVSWDAPITGVESIRELPFEPSWLNVKPSRFGTVESLLDSVEYALDRGMNLYGGGQFELDVGRGQAQALASVLYPDGPNDVAPGAYNDPDVSEGLPTSPLAPPADPRGFRW